MIGFLMVEQSKGRMTGFARLLMIGGTYMSL